MTDSLGCPKCGSTDDLWTIDELYGSSQFVVTDGQVDYLGVNDHDWDTTVVVGAQCLGCGWKAWFEQRFVDIDDKGIADAIIAFHENRAPVRTPAFGAVRSVKDLKDAETGCPQCGSTDLLSVQQVQRLARFSVRDGFIAWSDDSELVWDSLVTTGVSCSRCGWKAVSGNVESEDNPSAGALGTGGPKQ